MDRKYDRMNEKILSLTLEIIYLLTGEDYGPSKKFDHHVTSNCHQASGKLGKTQSPTMVPLHERSNEKNILDLTNKIIELLTGEVPIRHEDITVCFSMEEWEYIEEHRDLYKDVMMEDHRDRTSPGKRHLYKDIMMEDHRNRTPPGKRGNYTNPLINSL
ncbi:gastrula zinc finger protein XlCGF66.1-like [Rhinoderma darwinii]|uniref:gastrula zinc finger protein XlCGF66.1-like n=1 Tax=Rhinoderma darwinii TaxID=43563 RepID=UPI003F67DC32